MSKYLLSIVISVLIGRPSFAQNMESVSHFFKLVDTLEADYPISDSLWRQFLQLEGNRLFIETNGVPPERLQDLRNAWEILFRPSKDSLLQRSLQNDPLVTSFYPYKKHQGALRAYADWIPRHNMYDSIYTRAIEWLPKRMHQVKKVPYIYYIVIDNGGSANENGLLNSLWSSYELSHLKKAAYEGHEMHHFLRTSIALKPIGSSHKEVMRALELLLSEGTADLIDAKYWMQTETNGAFLKQKSANSPQMIRGLNAEIERLAQGKPGKDRSFYNQLFEGTNGHAPGYLMAKTIVDNGYKNELLASADDLFSFIYLYDKAAHKAKGKLPVLSSASIQFVHQLDRLYRSR